MGRRFLLWNVMPLAVEENPPDESGSPRGSFAMTEGTEIFRQQSDDLIPVSLSDLRVGPRVNAVCSGLVAESSRRRKPPEGSRSSSKKPSTTSPCVCSPTDATGCFRAFYVSTAGRLKTHHHVPLVHHLVHQYTKCQPVSRDIVASCRGTRITPDLA